METTTINVTLEGIVEEVPKYMGKFHRGPIFSIPFRVTGVEPLNAHKAYKGLLEKIVDVRYKEQALPISKGDTLRVYCNGYSLPETRAPNQVVEPSKIEITDKEGNAVAEYY